MSLFDKFKKSPKEQETKAPANPTNAMFFRVLAVGYVLWIMKDLVKAYLAGGPEAPSLTTLLVACILLGGGCVFVVVMSIRQYKQMKRQYDAYNEQVAAEYAAEEAAKLAEELEEDPADDEDTLELPEAEEEV